MHISSTTPASGVASPPALGGRAADAANPAMRDAFVDLGKALKSSDPQAARAAYAEMMRSAPEGSTWPKGSAFADLGKALLTQDMQGARQAYADMLRNGLAATRPSLPGGPRPAPAPAAITASSTGGLAGTLVNVSA
ncbi:MAG TPA: hypothetical protein PLF63_01680 [Rubrivivax sp.]|jgi:hypothetical protein|nr:hypothetical protein [Rubrivivax sp.]